ncbi:MAG: LapA family protein [Pirellulales bacterium]
MLKKLKWICLGLLTLLAAVVCLQNLTTIQLHFLFTKVELPQAVVIIATLILGFVMGMLANTLWKLRAWRAKASAEKAQQRKSTNSNNSESKSPSQ